MATDHSKQHYYQAQEVGGLYRFFIFHYDPSGNRHIAVHCSAAAYNTPEDAEDAAIQYVEESGLEDEVGPIYKGD